MLLFRGDCSRLGDRRLHHRARLVGLPAGPDRRRDDPGRVRGGRFRRQPARRRWCSPRAPSRPTRRSAPPSGRCWSGRWSAVTVESLALGLRAKVIRRPVLHLADGAGGAALIARGGAGAGLGLRRRRPARARDRAAARRRPGVGDPAQPQPRAAALGPGPERARPGRPGALDRPARRRRWRAPDQAIATDPEVLRAGGSVVRVLGTACGLGVEGSGWAVRPGLIVTNAHVVAGVRRHHGHHPGRDRARRDPRLLRPRGRPGAAASGRRTCRRCRSPTNANRGPTRPCSATRRTGPTRSRRRASARPSRRSARTPTATGRSIARSSALRGVGAQRQLRRAAGRRSRPGGGDRLRRDHRRRARRLRDPGRGSCAKPCGQTVAAGRDRPLHRLMTRKPITYVQ